MPSFKTDAEYVKAICLVMPTGETIWLEEEQGADYARTVIDKWKFEHPEMEQTPATMGAVHITMPRDRFLEVGGPGDPVSFQRMMAEGIEVPESARRHFLSSILAGFDRAIVSLQAERERLAQDIAATRKESPC